jgi:hypothetical protein
MIVVMHFRFHFVVMVLLFVPVSLAQSNRCELLPSEAKLAINQRFPTWRPKVLSDLDGYDKKLWLEMHPKECPGIAVGHFERPDQVAYAVLLIPKSGHDANNKIIILSKAANHYAVRMLNHSEGNPDSDWGLIISKEPPGTYSDMGSTKRVRLKLDSVNVEYLEKSSILYYWSQGKYLSRQTSD